MGRERNLAGAAEAWTALEQEMNRLVHELTARAREDVT